MSVHLQAADSVSGRAPTDKESDRWAHLDETDEELMLHREELQSSTALLIRDLESKASRALRSIDQLHHFPVKICESKLRDEFLSRYHFDYVAYRDNDFPKGFERQNHRSLVENLADFAGEPWGEIELGHFDEGVKDPHTTPKELYERTLAKSLDYLNKRLVKSYGQEVGAKRRIALIQALDTAEEVVKEISDKGLYVTRVEIRFGDVYYEDSEGGSSMYDSLSDTDREVLTADSLSAPYVCVSGGVPGAAIGGDFRITIARWDNIDVSEYGFVFTDALGYTDPVVGDAAPLPAIPSASSHVTYSLYKDGTKARNACEALLDERVELKNKIERQSEMGVGQ